MEEKFLKEEEKLKRKCLQPNFSFPKKLRILKSFEYKALQLSKVKLKGTYISIDYRFNSLLTAPKLGITVPSKMGKAYIRNRFKRIIREVFRINKHLLLSNLEINILSKDLKKDLKYSYIEQDFVSLISSINK
ncbi:MAG: ribonuclease P protein component [Parachlamydiales bacterium]|jgi:ribonuclease P protein component